MCVYIYIYIYVCMYMYIYIYIYIHIILSTSSGSIFRSVAWRPRLVLVDCKGRHISLSLSIYIYIYISTHPYITTMFFMAHCAHHQAHSQLHKFPARDQSRPCPFALFWPAACLKSLSWFCAWSFGRGSSQDYMFMSFCATRSTTCIDVCIVAVSVPILMLQSSITDMHT